MTSSACVTVLDAPMPVSMSAVMIMIAKIHIHRMIAVHLMRLVAYFSRSWEMSHTIQASFNCLALNKIQYMRL